MSVMEKRGLGTSKWTVKREHHNDRNRAETPSDPMHPNGRCVCGGEGECSWCVKFRDEEVEIDFGDLGEPEPGFYTKYALGAPSVPAIETEEDANRLFGKNSNSALDAIAYLEKSKGQQADRRVVEAMSTMRPPGVPMTETQKHCCVVDDCEGEDSAGVCCCSKCIQRRDDDAGEFSREEAGANLARLNARVRVMSDHLKIITEERDEYQRALVELRQEFEAMRVDRDDWQRYWREKCDVLEAVKALIEKSEEIPF